MRFISLTSRDGVSEQLFTLGGVPGVLWAPEGATGAVGAGGRPLILMGHGGGQHKKAPDVVSRARHFAAEGGFAVAAIDTPNHGERPKDEELDRIATENQARADAGEDPAELVAALQARVAGQVTGDWQAVLTALQEHGLAGAGPVGYWGISMGGGLGVPFVAAEPRVGAAVLGLTGSPGLAATAARITVPVRFLVQWDDERIPRAHSLAVFGALASAEKSLHASPGGHMDLPPSEADDSLRFFARHLC